MFKTTGTKRYYSNHAKVAEHIDSVTNLLHAVGKFLNDILQVVTRNSITSALIGILREDCYYYK